MKKNKLLLLVLIAAFAGCKKEDPIPGYLGTYTANFTTTERFYGAVRSEQSTTGKVVVTQGSASNTIRIDNLTDVNGKVIDFEVKAGKYYYNAGSTSQGCSSQYTIEGKFEGNTIYFNRISSRNCNNDYRVTNIEVKGYK